MSAAREVEDYIRSLIARIERVKSDEDDPHLFSEVSDFLWVSGRESKSSRRKEMQAYSGLPKAIIDFPPSDKQYTSLFDAMAKRIEREKADVPCLVVACLTCPHMDTYADVIADVLLEAAKNGKGDLSFTCMMYLWTSTYPWTAEETKSHVIAVVKECSPMLRTLIRQPKREILADFEKHARWLTTGRLEET